MSEFEILTLQQANRDFWLSVIIAIVSFVSAYIVYKDYKDRKNKERAEKSIQIAKEFAYDIIAPLTQIHDFIKEIGIGQIINKIDFLKLEDFDIDELTSLYSKNDIDKYKKIINENDQNLEIRNMIFKL